MGIGNWSIHDGYGGKQQQQQQQQIICSYIGALPRCLQQHRTVGEMIFTERKGLFFFDLSTSKVDK